MEIDKIYNMDCLEGMKQNNNDVITAAAYSHAMRLIEEYYPDMPNERKRAQALRLAEKICKKEKH